MRILLVGAVLCSVWGVSTQARAFGPPYPIPAPPPPAAAPPATPAASPVVRPSGASATSSVVGPATPPTAAKLAEARLHFQQGVALYREQNYDAALAEFLGAYGISGEPIVIYNLGLTYKALFRYGEAMEILQRYLDESAAHGHPVSKDRRAEVERIIAEMKSLLADVTIVLKPAEATLRVDDRPVSLGIEGVLKLPAGSHVIEAAAADFSTQKREITVVAGTPQNVSLVLAAIPHSGTVTITTPEIGARVTVDGRDLGPTPAVVELSVGGHQIEVSAPGYVANRSELSVAAGQSRTVSIVLELPRVESAPLYHRWWFWAGLGAVAAVTVTTVLLVSGRSTQGPLDGSLGPPANSSVLSQ
jgi:hypothetical protein